MSKEISGIQQAVKQAGSQSQLARQVGVSPQAVQQWVERGCVPPRRVPVVADVTGVPAYLLNPESHFGHHRGPVATEAFVCETPAPYCREDHNREATQNHQTGDCRAKDSEHSSGAVDRRQVRHL